MNNSQNGMYGFTILELLVVIAIISAIIIMGFSNYSGAQKRARDTRRKSDLKQIQKALELFRQVQVVPAFPAPPLAPPGQCASSGPNCTGTIFMNVMPGDPNRTLSAYSYIRPTTLTYTLCACLENAGDPDGQSGDCDASYVCGGATGKKYELIQP